MRYKHHPRGRNVLDRTRICQTPRRCHLLHCAGLLLDEHRVVAWCCLRLSSNTATHLVQVQPSPTDYQEFIIRLWVIEAHRKQTPKQFWWELQQLTEAVQGDRRAGAHTIRGARILRISGEWASIHVCRARDKKRCDDPPDLRLNVLRRRNDKLACNHRYVSITV